MPLLVLPYLVERLKSCRDIAGKAWLTLLVMFVFLAAIAVVSPQNLEVTSAADMRYVPPVILMGGIATACAIVIASRWLGVAAAAVLSVGAIALTNVAYPGVGKVRCTLCELVRETATDHPSGTDAAVAFGRTLPAGTSVKTIPEHFTTSLQFYAPRLRYTGVLDPGKKLDPGLRAVLPDYLFSGYVPAEVLLVGVGAVRTGASMRLDGAQYRLDDVIPTLWVDQTRPELPWHRFRPDPVMDSRHGIAVFRRVADGGG